LNARNRWVSGIALARIAAIALTALPSFGEAMPDPAPFIPRAAGEGLRWTISYGLLKLGDLALTETESSEGFRLGLEIRSNRKLPIAPLSYSYESDMDAESKPLRFACRSSRGSDRKSEECLYDYRAGLVRVSRDAVKDGERSAKTGELPLTQNLFDGITLIGWMMALRGSGLERRACFIGDMKAVPLELRFSAEAEWIRLPSAAAPLRAYRVDGRLSGSGIAGLAGTFTLWLSADPSRLPLRAVLRLWIGEAVILLENPDSSVAEAAP
jgi:hypothetical protein